jgi:hypothetical protein
LKLGISHTKGFWHYKYRSQGKQKKNQSKKQSQNQSKNPEKEIIHREKERKGNQHTQRIVPAIAFIFADISAQKKKNTSKQIPNRLASSSSSRLQKLLRKQKEHADK